jgi:hypothetical protein
MGKDDTKVDAEVKLEIMRMEKSIISAVTKLFSDSNATLEKGLRERYDLKIEHLEKEQERSFKYHEEHFEASKSLNERQTKDEGKEAGKDKAESKTTDKKSVFWTAVGSMGAIIAILVTILIFTLSP